jgi:hypothetical protein
MEINPNFSFVVEETVLSSLSTDYLLGFIESDDDFLKIVISLPKPDLVTSIDDINDEFGDHDQIAHVGINKNYGDSDPERYTVIWFVFSGPSRHDVLHVDSAGEALERGLEKAQQLFDEWEKMTYG